MIKELFDYLDYIAVEGEEVVEDTPVEDNVETTEPEETPDTEVEEETEPISEFDIDGEKVTLDQIKEWKNSGLRQSDYTKKTQEVANMRKEAEQALEIFNYLKTKPDLVQKLVELDSDNPMQVNKVKETLDPALERVNQIEQKLVLQQIDSELKEITSKDKSVSDLDLLNIANEKHCTVKEAYVIWRGQNLDKILASKEKELKAKIAKEVKDNKGTTKTLITAGDKTVNDNTFGLSETEQSFATKLGMSLEEYSKYKSNKSVW
jgi:hypothetical protein